MNNNLKIQFSELMHEIMIKNKKIIEKGDYSNLLSLCEQDITILSMLDRREDLTAKEISNTLKVAKTTIVTAVSRLSQRGYIRRIQNENDRREMHLQLTEKGMKANREHLHFEEVFLDALVNRWNDEEQEALAELIKRRGDFNETLL